MVRYLGGVLILSIHSASYSWLVGMLIKNRDFVFGKTVLDIKIDVSLQKIHKEE